MSCQAGRTAHEAAAPVLQHRSGLATSTLREPEVNMVTIITIALRRVCKLASAARFTIIELDHLMILVCRFSRNAEGWAK